jgi:hypothetical protein
MLYAHYTLGAEDERLGGLSRFDIAGIALLLASLVPFVKFVITRKKQADTTWKEGESIKP